MSGRRGRTAGGLTRAALMASAALTAAAPFGLSAQDYTHPRQMNLPAPSFRRPDPATVQHRLGNGLVAYVVEDRTVPLVTLAATVRVGSTDEPRPGAAAGLERAFRSGPGAVPAADVQRALAEMTAEFTVNVGRELTEITLNVPAEDAWRALDLLGGLLRQPRITVPDQAPSRGVELRADRAAGESGPVLYQGSMPVAVALFEDLLYGDHVYGRGASNSSAAPLAETEVTDFHRRFVVPGNVVLAVAGDVDAAEARRRVGQVFGDWRGPRPPRPAAVPPLPLDAGEGGVRGIHTYDVDRLQGWLVIGHELPVVPVEDEAPLQVMNYILAGDHLAGRMFVEARDRRGLANDEIGHPEPRLRGPGTYTIRAAGRPESITQLMDVAFREVARIQAEPVTEEELFVAKGALADGEFPFAFRHGHATALALAREWASYGDHRRSATYPDRIRGVTAAAVTAAARKYLVPDRMQVVLLGPIAAIRQAAGRGGHPTLEQFGAVRPGR